MTFRERKDMSEYFTVTFSRAEAIEFCKFVEKMELQNTQCIIARVYRYIMRDMSRETVKEKVEDVR